ncbi:MAG: hypothetical protein J2P17_06155 [Mycobacterium sp.]|nr:hypothetical protein [Mycobacterium sp.]
MTKNNSPGEEVWLLSSRLDEADDFAPVAVFGSRRKAKAWARARDSAIVWTDRRYREIPGRRGQVFECIGQTAGEFFPGWLITRQQFNL